MTDDTQPPLGAKTDAVGALGGTGAVGALVERRAVTLKLCAYALGYPDASLRENAAEALGVARAHGLQGLADALRVLGETDGVELEQAYVRAFDFAEAASLYLTAHEYGDDRKRGVALVELRKMLGAGGFEEAEGELPDHVPLLLEFLALSSAHGEGQVQQTAGLERRLGTVMRAVGDHIDVENIYHMVMSAVLRELGWERSPATEAEDADAALQREQPDLEDLPYPVSYT